MMSAPSIPAIVLAMAGSLMLSALLSRLLCSRWLARLGALDIPNARSLHRHPVPRTGGLAVLIGVLVPLVVLAVLGGGDSMLAWLGAALALVAGVSFADDLGGLSRRLRLGAHLLAALLLILAGLRWDPIELPGLLLMPGALVSSLLTLLYLVWMINLYNFMDGMDGLAGGMALFGFGALAVLGVSGGEPLFGLVSALLAASAAGFLSANLPPARLFLGDVGSSSLGLLAAALGLWGQQLGLFPLWVAALAFSPFILDATSTLLARLARGEPVWEAHRSHHYQRLVLAGWSHGQVLARAYPLMAAAAASAIAAPRLPVHEQGWLLGAWALIYVFVHFKVRLVERAAAREDAPA